jgi:ketosteroid isomerase-like protein
MRVMKEELAGKEISMWKRISMVVPVIICIVVSVNALIGGESQEDLKAKVEAIGEKAEKAFIAGDVETMLQYYSDDIISMPQDHEMIRGKADLKKMTEAIIKSGVKFLSLESETLEVRSCGELIYEIGTYSQSVVMPNVPEPVTGYGKYLTVWEKQADGTLKIAVEIYNTSKQPESQATPRVEDPCRK